MTGYICITYHLIFSNNTHIHTLCCRTTPQWTHEYSLHSQSFFWKFLCNFFTMEEHSFCFMFQILPYVVWLSSQIVNMWDKQNNTLIYNNCEMYSIKLINTCIILRSYLLGIRYKYLIYSLLRKFNYTVHCY